MGTKRKPSYIIKSIPVCKKKRAYANSYLAWQHAAYYSIKNDNFQIPYKCPVGNHYHTTSHTTIGDASHIPQQYKELFILLATEPTTTQSFWQKLRNFLV